MVTGISLEQAVELITGKLSPLGSETLPALQALGRTLASDVTAPVDQPPFDRSLWTAMLSALLTSPGRTGTTPSVCRW